MFQGLANNELYDKIVDRRIQTKADGLDQATTQELFKAMIERCATKPLGEAEIIYTSCDETNEKAISLYRKVGFETTGERIDGEIVLKRCLLGGQANER